VILIAAAPVSPGPGEDSTLVDEVAAVVAGKFQSNVPPQLVSRWDLEVECRLESVHRYGEAGVDRPISTAMRTSVLSDVIEDYVIYREALRLDEVDVPEAALADELSALAGDLGTERFLSLLAEAHVSEPKVRRIVERRVAARRYVVDNLKLTMSLTESELEASFESMNHPFEGESLSDVRERFRQWLLETRAVSHRENLLEELSARSRVFVFYEPASLEV
jgi:hypothetical protein